MPTNTHSDVDDNVWNTKISAFKELTAGTASPHVGFFVLFKSRLFLFLSCLYNNLSNFNRKLHRPIRLSWISCWYWGEVWTLILCWRWISWLLTRWIKALIERQQSGDLIYIAEMTWLIYQKNFKKLIWLIGSNRGTDVALNECRDNGCCDK